MTPQQMSKVRRLTRVTRVRNTPGHRGVEGPYWRGHWIQNRKRITVHIGKTLPTPLLALLESRYKKPGASHWTWPRPADLP